MMTTTEITTTKRFVTQRVPIHQHIFGEFYPYPMKGFKAYEEDAFRQKTYQLFVGEEPTDVHARILEILPIPLYKLPDMLFDNFTIHDMDNSLFVEWLKMSLRPEPIATSSIAQLTGINSVQKMEEFGISLIKNDQCPNGMVALFIYKKIEL